MAHDTPKIRYRVQVELADAGGRAGFITEASGLTFEEAQECKRHIRLRSYFRDHGARIRIGQIRTRCGPAASQTLREVLRAFHG